MVKATDFKFDTRFQGQSRQGPFKNFQKGACQGTVTP